MYGAGLAAVAGGVAVGGATIATTGAQGTGVVVAVAGVVGVLLAYRSLRIRRASALDTD